MLTNLGCVSTAVWSPEWARNHLKCLRIADALIPFAITDGDTIISNRNSRKTFLRVADHLRDFVGGMWRSHEGLSDDDLDHLDEAIGNSLIVSAICTDCLTTRCFPN